MSSILIARRRRAFKRDAWSRAKTIRAVCQNVEVAALYSMQMARDKWNGTV